MKKWIGCIYKINVSNFFYLFQRSSEQFAGRRIGIENGAINLG